MHSSPIDYDSKFISRAGKRWRPSGIRGLFPLEARQGMISMLAGKPNPTTFPFESISVTLKPSAAATGKEPETLRLSGSELDAALQYGPTAGQDDFLSWIYQLQQRTHARGKPQDEGWSCAVGAGSQELMEKAFAAVCDPEDTILMETPVYSGTLGFLQPSGRTLIAPLERKRLILELVRKYDLLLFEDDAYYFLHFDPQNRAPSYFSLEKSDGGQTGRVIRFDSLRLKFPSKFPGNNLYPVKSFHLPSSVTQAITCKLLTHWGHERFEKHCEQVSQFYSEKLEVVNGAAERHLAGLAEWNKPVAGMFLWLKLKIAPPGKEDEADSSDLIATRAVQKGVLAVPGFAFLPNAGKSPYVRTSFSLIDAASADEGFARLASVIREARVEAGLE
ncbi:hypothetical protein VP01_874g5 [Puccinia sorghi]|uniref:Aminotransferase class I/classII domain-containing protein n=1 Tax=Puccinia sorghi TaxID=27349 RepID=A0A0L6UAR9_9BASI|nr:hypothetical protein VP01_874g5 [Puccinia sorghi]